MHQAVQFPTSGLIEVRREGKGWLFCLLYLDSQIQWAIYLKK